MDLFRERESKISISPRSSIATDFRQLSVKLVVLFLPSFFFLCLCALKSYPVIFPLSVSVSLFPVALHGMQLGSLRDPSLSISFLLRGSLYAPIGTRLAVIWTSKEIRKRYRNEKFYSAVCPKHRMDGISGSFCVPCRRFFEPLASATNLSPSLQRFHVVPSPFFPPFPSFSFDTNEIVNGLGGRRLNPNRTSPAIS